MTITQVQEVGNIRQYHDQLELELSGVRIGNIFEELKSFLETNDVDGNRVLVISGDQWFTKPEKVKWCNMVMCIIHRLEKYNWDVKKENERMFERDLTVDEKPANIRIIGHGEDTSKDRIRAIIQGNEHGIPLIIFSANEVPEMSGPGVFFAQRKD